ncbi:Hypothetical_protein [Hexamita inflata]|uniref:Hypothetical_protein n=1 Tax=Hexamita inflata TaxID=28002 RepID=A0AA86QFF0_9EUKA|nr:Hypothetical protein HINF_LOCUS39802 [Hexamita inflata]
MLPCRIIEHKLFRSINHMGFYAIENNCIVVYYYINSQKIEYFFNIDDLDKQMTKYDKCILLDPKSGLKMIVNPFRKGEEDSLKLKIYDSCEYFNYEANGSVMYSEIIQNNVENTPSFKVGRTLKYFEE